VGCFKFLFQCALDSTRASRRSTIACLICAHSAALRLGKSGSRIDGTVASIRQRDKSRIRRHFGHRPADRVVISFSYCRGLIGQMTIGIGRRQFISALGGIAFAWPLAARGQQPGKLPTIGLLTPDASSWGGWTAAFAGRLSELGWIEGRTVAIEYRWSEGHPERVAEIAAEFVQQKVDVIVTYGGAVAAVKQATASIPIVFAIAGDPVGSGFVANLAHPGGNVTGMSLAQNDIASKRLELLRDVVPNLRRLAIMFNADYPSSVRETGEVQAAARALGLEVAPHEIRRAEDIAPVFETLKSQADALYVVEDTLIFVNRTPIVMLALGARLPTIFGNRDFVQAGALMSYGPNYPALFQRTADFVDKILRGTKPGEIPVEQPTKFELIINLITANALGLTVPDKIQALADEVIE
jgi:putative ABC transport system substrate-binding protein